jgi:hypothetical protein
MRRGPSGADAHAAAPEATTHIAVRTAPGPGTTVKTDAAAASSQGDARLRVGHWRRGKGVRRHTRQPQEKSCNQDRRISHILISQLAAVRCGPMQNSLRLNRSQPNAKTYCPARLRNAQSAAAFLKGNEFCSISANRDPRVARLLAARHCRFTSASSKRQYLDGTTANAAFGRLAHILIPSEPGR